MVDIDPPWRLDPLQTITDVHWGRRCTGGSTFNWRLIVSTGSNVALHLAELGIGFTGNVLGTSPATFGGATWVYSDLVGFYHWEFETVTFDDHCRASVSWSGGDGDTASNIMAFNPGWWVLMASPYP